MNFSTFKLVGFIVAALICVGTLVVSDYFSTRIAVNKEATRAEQSAVLLASGFERELEKFRLASLVLAQDPDVSAVISEDGPNLVDTLNLKLESLAHETKASAIYVIDKSGTTLSASNWRLPDSFVGENYNFRAYFKESFATGSFEQFALGSISGKPGLYIANRIDAEDSQIGVVVIKVEFDDLEQEWSKTGYIAFATNQKGIILVTSKPEWRFQTTEQLSNAERARILQRLEYGDRPLKMNEHYASNRVALAGSPEATRRPYIDAVETLALDWVVHALTSTEEAVKVAVNRSRLVLLITLMALAAIIAVVAQLRRNEKLKIEAELEKQTKQMRDRLTQANKLATLGQIAAGVGHEINQPLATIGSFASNASKYLDANNVSAVQNNLARITALVDRIGNITSELRGFAKKATGILEPVSVISAIEGALLLLRDRVTSSEATISFQNKKNDVQILAEKNRLEQVFVNLFQNSLDAGGSGTHIDISFLTKDNMVEIVVSDSGPGLTEQTQRNLFQPFTSSKREGLGLGLVISRDIISDFGGELVHQEGAKGATFLLRLKVAQ